MAGVELLRVSIQGLLTTLLNLNLLGFDESYLHTTY